MLRHTDISHAASLKWHCSYQCYYTPSVNTANPT